MAALSLFAASLADIVVGGSFVVVGILFARRAFGPEARLAARMFSLWWYGLAGVAIVAGFANNGGLLGLAVAIAGPGFITPDVASGFVLAWLLFSCVALWGLLAYLWYLYRGRNVALVLGVAYAFVFVAFALVAIYESPTLVVPSDLGVRVEYARPVSNAAVAALLVFLVLPEIAGAVAYASLYSRAPTRSARYRIALVSGSLIIFLGLSLLAGALRVETTPLWLIASRLLALASAATILFAYSPPAAIRRRLEAPMGGDRA